MKELDEIDQLFQTTFEGFEQTPDQSVKTNIDRAIASKKKRRRFLFILFPILVGSSILAATGYFHPGSGKPTPERNSIAQNQSTKETQTTQLPEINKQEKRETTPQTAAISDKNQTGSIRTNQFQAKTSHPKNAPVRTNFDAHSTIKTTLPANGQSSSSNLKPDLNESENQSAELTPAIAKTDDPIRDKSDSTIAQINNQDSLTASTSVDSSATKELVTAVDKPDLLLEPTKAHSKWSLSLLTGWENESKKPAERFDSTEFSGTSEEYARIQSTSFYGKIELNRRINNRVDFLFGLGFHSRKITQAGSLYSLDSFPLFENVSSTPTDTFGYFIRKQNESRISQVNSVILPLGISYSVPLGNVFRFRISGGTELAYSWITETQSAPHLSTPKFNAFGWNVWLRPEIHYTFGKCQLFGFGSINQPLLQQLKWDFNVRRNPAFGAGIGLLIHL